MKLKKINKKRKLETSGENRVIGWSMTPGETKTFFDGLGKKVITLYGYSSGYEDEEAMIKIVRSVLSDYSPETYIVNIGATAGGIGAAYKIAKSMGFITTGIVSSLAIEWIDSISPAVDHICFIEDTMWGGNLQDTDALSPTSEAMVACSDILIGVGGGEICRDELLAGKEQGKPTFFYPAEIHHKYWIRQAKKKGLPAPDSFWGAAHEEFAQQDPSNPARRKE